MTDNYDKTRVKGLDYLKTVFGEESVENAIENTTKFQVEVPGWQLWAGFGGGGRFEGASSGGFARNTKEIAEDVGLIHKLTKSTPLVGQHILWFLSKDGKTGDKETAKKVQIELKENGLSMGSISPTFFLAGSEDGSLSSQNPATRKRYIEQILFGADIACEMGNGIITLWFPDGTNYPGQRELKEKVTLIKDGLETFWEKVPEKHKKGLERVLVEYKVFEPGTYSTTVPDWGTSRELARTMGEKGGVLIDLGHHHHGTNIEQIVANLIAFQIPAGFHFNTRYAADDDHSVQADYQMACIFYELISGNVMFNRVKTKNWSFALDQMARLEQRIPSVLKSVDALKISVAKASLIDNNLLKKQQKSLDLIKSSIQFEKSMLHTDVSPIVMESYHRMGLHPVPMEAFYQSGYQEKVTKERK